MLAALSSPGNTCIGRKSFMDQQATRMSNTSQLPLSLHYVFGFPTCNLDLCIFAQNVDIGVKTAGTAVLCCCPASQKGCKEGGCCHDYACLNLVPDSGCRDRCRWISFSGFILLLIQGPERSGASEHHKKHVLCGSFAIWRPPISVGRSSMDR